VNCGETEEGYPLVFVVKVHRGGTFDQPQNDIPLFLAQKVCEFSCGASPGSVKLPDRQTSWAVWYAAHVGVNCHQPERTIAEKDSFANLPHFPI
jgi:hypothetical protein